LQRDLVSPPSPPPPPATTCVCGGGAVAGSDPSLSRSRSLSSCPVLSHTYRFISRSHTYTHHTHLSTHHTHLHTSHTPIHTHHTHLHTSHTPIHTHHPHLSHHNTHPHRPTTLYIEDTVQIPEHIAPGEYVLGWRWDCEETTQIWQSCSDITIV
jgi:hypothetical protein